MSAADLQPIISAIIAAIAAIITGLTAYYVPKAIAAFEKRTGVQITDQERAAVMSAVTTAAGLLQTKLDQGVLKVADITPGNPEVIKETQASIATVSTAVAAQTTTPDTIARMVVARVDTSPKPVAIVPAVVQQRPGAGTMPGPSATGAPSSVR